MGNVVEETSPYKDIEWWVEIEKTELKHINYNQILLILKNLEDDKRLHSFMAILDKHQIKYNYDSWA